MKITLPDGSDMDLPRGIIVKRTTSSLGDGWLVEIDGPIRRGRFVADSHGQVSERIRLCVHRVEDEREVSFDDTQAMRREIESRIAAAKVTLPIAEPFVAIVAGRCENCKNWTRWKHAPRDDSVWGYCGAALGAMVNTAGYAECRADFGCVLFQSKVDASE